MTGETGRSRLGIVTIVSTMRRALCIASANGSPQPRRAVPREARAPLCQSGSLAHDARPVLSTAVLLCLSQVVPPGLGSQPGDLDGGEPIGDAFTGCGQCHDRTSAPNGAPLYMPFDGWVSSMMANGVKDPLFRASLDVANQDLPGIGTWCLRCHAPQSYVRGHGLRPDGGALDALDRQGVTCDVCHRSLAAPGATAPVIGNAQLYLERGRVKYGPHGDVTNTAHGSSDAGITGSSELCGQCHQVSNPLVAWRDPKDAGVIASEFPLDSTYDEWKQSKYARPGTLTSCQDCHMPRMQQPDGGALALRVAQLGPDRSAPRRHALVGGNVWGLEALQKNDPSGTALLVEQFDESKRLTRELLAKAAEVVLTTPTTVPPEGLLRVKVRVINKAGHKLPTGFADGRRIVVQVLIDGKLLTGGFDGGAVIDDGWLRVYRARHGTLDAGPQEHLVKHEVIYEDTRIPPAGFHPPPGAATTPVPDFFYAAGDGGWNDYDEVEWHVDLPPTLKHGQTFDVTARLLYQSTTPEHVRFLHAENRSTDAGQNLLDVWRATNEAAPVEMTRAVRTVAVIDPDAGVPDAGGTSSGAGGGDELVTNKCGCTATPPQVFFLLLAATLLRVRRRIE